jgi:hypothetical protein
MHQQIDVEALRASLAKMSRAEVRSLAIGAGLKPSTIEKFRLNHIAEPRLSKLEKLRDALAARPKAKKAHAVAHGDGEKARA